MAVDTRRSRTGRVDGSSSLGRTNVLDRGRLPKPQIKGARTPTLMILEDDFSFASSLARLAEFQGIPVSVFWNVGEVMAASLHPFSFGVIIADQSLWSELLRRLDPHVKARLGHVPLLLLDGHARQVGPVAVLESALKQLHDTAADPVAGGERPHSQEGSESERLALGATVRLAVVDCGHAFPSNLKTSAKRRGVALDVYQDIDQVRHDPRWGLYGAVIVSCDLGALWGLDLSAALRAALGDVPVVLVTEAAHEEARERPVVSPHVHVYKRGRDEADGVLEMALTLANRWAARASFSGSIARDIMADSTLPALY